MVAPVARPAVRPSGWWYLAAIAVGVAGLVLGGILVRDAFFAAQDAGFDASLTPAGEDQIEVGGEAAVLLTYPDCPPDLGLFHLWAAVVHDGQAFHIVWYNEPGSEDGDRQDFEALLATLTFLG